MNISVWITHPEVDCWNFSERQRAAIEESLPEVTVSVHDNEAAFVHSLPRTDIALIWTFRQEWFARAPRLRWIVTPAAGKDLFTVDPPPGVEIEYSSFHGEIMAETVLGLMLAHRRGLLDALRLERTDPWPRRVLAPDLLPLRGSHLVVLGFGNIGRWIARLAAPFGVDVTGVRRLARAPADTAGGAERVVGLDTLDRVLPSADFLVLALPGDRSTDRILDERRLDLLGEDAVLINVGRGNAVDERALADRLRSGALGAAYLDVVSEEPLPGDSPLRDCPHLLVLPHISAVSPTYLDLFAAEFVRKFRSKYGNAAPPPTTPRDPSARGARRR